MKINAHTDLYCIFGIPVKHSFSPLMHNRAFHQMNINAVYLAFEPSSIEQAVKSMKALSIKGASITIPFKIEALKYIDDIDHIAEDIGSVNTLHNINGRIKGYNTDGLGAIEALKKIIKIEGSSFLIIGNGGSARAIAFTLAASGSNVAIAGRNIERIRSLADDLKIKYKEVKYILLKDLDKEYMKSIDVIINTTPVGMHPDLNSTPVDEKLISENHVVFDIVYSPDITRLLKSAQNKGCRIIRGIEMLINQGAEQIKIWTGNEAPIEAMIDVILEHFKEIYAK